MIQENDVILLREQCNSYLDLIASEVHVLLPCDIRLYGDLAYIPQTLYKYFNDALFASKRDFHKLGLDPCVFWGVTRICPELEKSHTTIPRLRPEASVLIDRTKIQSESNTYYILFTEAFVRDIFLAFDSILSLPSVLANVGHPDTERPKGEIIQRPQDDQRKQLAVYMAITAIEFAFYHEFFHVACGHLYELHAQHNRQAMYAVGSKEPIDVAEASIHKVFELDADLMALVAMVNNLRNNTKTVKLPFNITMDFSQRFEFLSFSITVLFRCIELWRRDVRLIYSNSSDHPHPDIRDSCLFSYFQKNISDREDESKAYVDAYRNGRNKAIDSISALDGAIPTFELHSDLGRDLAFRELDSLVSQVNHLRKTGVSHLDIRMRRKSQLSG